MEQFINPEHPAIQKLAMKLRNKPYPGAELRWIRENILYGMEGCLDLELELKKPISLRKDYEVLKTREGICVEQSFLLASLLRNRIEPKKVKLVHVCTNRKLYEEYLLEEILDPFNHMCVTIEEEWRYKILDPTAGIEDAPYEIYLLRMTIPPILEFMSKEIVV